MTDEEKLHLPAGRTVKEAIAVAVKHKRLIWEGQAGRGLNEDEKVNLLIETCTELCSKDKHSGRQLAQMAIWS
jgi:hypothetical protein